MRAMSRQLAFEQQELRDCKRIRCKVAAPFKKILNIRSSFDFSIWQV